MLSTQNNVTLIGAIASEKRITEFENGNKIVRFIIATDDNNNDTHNKHKHKVFAWGNIAQFIEKYGHKGKRIFINGRLVVRTYLNQKGIAQTISEVEIRQIVEL